MFLSFLDAKARWEFLRSEYQKNLNKQKTKNGQTSTKIAK